MTFAYQDVCNELKHRLSEAKRIGVRVLALKVDITEAHVLFMGRERDFTRPGHQATFRGVPLKVIQ